MKRLPQARLSAFTTFRLGGPCRELFDCATAGEVREAAGILAARGEPFLLIGGGSNLLVSDRGLGTSVIRFASDVPDVREEDGALLVGAATGLEDFARITVERGLEGLVCCSGIPGTVGGAIVGNAGAFGEQIGDHLESVVLLDRTGAIRVVPAGELGFTYRHSRLQDSGDVVLEARFALRPGDRAALLARRAEILALRAAKHPDWHTTPTAGSFFKNIEPTSKAGRRQAAGWFLEQAGAMGLRVGGAHAFGKHANIIVADPGCAAEDVRRLSEQMAALVLEKFGLRLEREVKLLGDFASG